MCRLSRKSIKNQTNKNIFFSILKMASTCLKEQFPADDDYCQSLTWSIYEDIYVEGHPDWIFNYTIDQCPGKHSIIILSIGQTDLGKQCRTKSDCSWKLLKDQSDQGLHCLPFCIFLDTLLFGQTAMFSVFFECLKFVDFYSLFFFSFFFSPIFWLCSLNNILEWWIIAHYNVSSLQYM